MSKIIKASQIIGNYQLNNFEKEEKQNKKEEEQRFKDEEKKQLKKAEKIIKDAKKEAKKIVNEAQLEKQKIEKLKEEAYQKGFKEGKKDGYQDIKEELNKTLETLNAKVENLKKQYKEELNILKPQLIDIATKMASKIINTRIDDNPEIINNIVGDVLNDLSNNHQQFVINVNPEILPYLNRNKLKSSYPESEFKFNADNSLKKGDCVINTNFGGKDAYLVDKLKRLKKRIIKEMDLN